MKKFPVRWHVLGWLGYVGYRVTGDILSEETSAKVIWTQLSGFAVELLVFYLCYLVIFPRLLRPGQLTKLTAALIGVVILYSGLRYAVEEMLYPALLGFHNYSDGVPTSHIFFYSLYYSLPAIAASAALWAGENTLRQERENQQLRQEKRAAETAFLKAQINPHFLYNTLNLLYGMAYPVSKPLAAALLRLAELMRYLLYDSAADQVALSHEIDYLRNYLALYHLRFPNQLCVDFTVTGEPADRRIAPLVLIPFVENAFKHGILDDPAHPVRICLRVEPQEVVFQVENRISAGPKDATSGIGLPNLRRRLALQYPGRHQLRITAAEDRFATLLRVTK